MRNMRMMRIMRICGICGCVCGLKISSTLYTYEYLPKMATFWARNGSAWLCFQFWVPKISLLFIPPGFIHPQEWKLRVQNHKILVKKRWFFFTIDAVYAHWCASDAHRCASAKIGAWPTLLYILLIENIVELLCETTLCYQTPQPSVERPAIVWSNRSLSDRYALLPLPA